MTHKVLVTGTKGLVGSCAARALHNEGYEVIGLYRQLGLEQANLPWRAIECDLLDYNAPQILKSIDFDLIVHCAAVLPSQLTGKDAEEAAHVNRVIDDLILALCLRGAHPLIYTSTMSVYGLSRRGVATEEDKPNPIGEYALEKARSESKILGSLAEGAIVFRISSPYGPGQRRKNVLRIFIERALAGFDLVYHGSGKRQQDFISAEDVGKAVVCVVSRNKSKGIFNIASGNPVSMRNLAELVVRTVAGSRSRIVPSGVPDPQENFRAAYSISKARDVLGWRPSVPLVDGIRNWAQYLKVGN